MTMTAFDTAARPVMQVLDLTLPTPEANLACDEALLDECEAGAGGEVLRFWESPSPFVVLGMAGRREREVRLAACAARGIPVLRRCSGGGAVVQGPGCLSYSLVLHITAGGGGAGDGGSDSGIAGDGIAGDGGAGGVVTVAGGAGNRIAGSSVVRSHVTGGCGAGRSVARSSVPRSRVAGSSVARSNTARRGPLEHIDSTNAFVMERHRRALAAATGLAIRRQGATDLAVERRKFSGNAQRRRRRCLLFHGTFLLDFPIPLVEELLPYPPTAPAYRARRRHSDFLTNLRQPASRIKELLRRSWNATPGGAVPSAAIAALVARKYGARCWNERC